MRTEEIKRMVEVTNTMYIADNGMRSTSADECKSYEKKQLKSLVERSKENFMHPANAVFYTCRMRRRERRKHREYG